MDLDPETPTLDPAASVLKSRQSIAPTAALSAMISDAVVSVAT